MRWYGNLYVGGSIAHHKIEKIKWKIRHNAGLVNIYVITLASNPKNLLDIIPSQELMQKAYPKKKLYVIGLACGYEASLELVRQIVDEVYQNTGTFDIVSYLNVKKDSVNY